MKILIFRIGKFLKPIMLNLPTDSLYKFIFIGCLALIVFFYNSLDKRTKDFKQQNHELDLKFVELSLRDSNLAESYSLLDTIFKTTTNNRVRERAEIKFEGLSVEKEALEIDYSKFEKLSNRLENEYNDLVSYKKRIWWIIASLLVIASLSCLCWYFRIQIYEDRILKEKAPKKIK